MDFKLDLYGEVNEDMVQYVAQSFRENYSQGCTIEVAMDSVGGSIESANDIAEILVAAMQDGSNVIAYNTGNVMSAATVIFLASTVRLFDHEAGEFVIHQPSMYSEGTADEILQAAVGLVQTEEFLVNLYSHFSDTPKEKILEIMKEDRALTPEEIEMLGLAKIVE